MSVVGDAESEAVGAGVGAVTVSVLLADEEVSAFWQVTLYVVDEVGDTLRDPLVAPPVLKPEPVQLVAFDEDQESVVLLPRTIDEGDAESDAFGAGATTVYVMGQIRSTR